MRLPQPDVEPPGTPSPACCFDQKVETCSPIQAVKTHTLVLAGFLALALASVRAADLSSVARAVDEHYNQLRTLQADFAETYRGNGMDRTESGTLWLKKPGKMRWEYRSPREKLFLSDGKDAWFYVPGDKQARKTPVRKLEDLRSPLGLLLGKTRLEKELQGLSFAPDVTPLDPADIVLRGVPKAMADRVAQVLIEVTPGNQIRRIQVDEVDGSVTEYRFSGQKENLTLGDERFHFTPGPGVETIQGELGQ
jgi:outer membrane lipoprotein carrier protein